MIIRNGSSYPTERVRQLIKFATKPIDMRHVCVNVRNSGHAFAGRAYPRIPSISNAPPSSRYLISLRIGPRSKFPLMHRYTGGSKRFPQYELTDWEEALVMLAAHEALHIEQYREAMSRSELRAELFAVRRLEAFREAEGRA